MKGFRVFKKVCRKLLIYCFVAVPVYLIFFKPGKWYQSVEQSQMKQELHIHKGVDRIREDSQTWSSVNWHPINGPSHKEHELELDEDANWIRGSRQNRSGFVKLKQLKVYMLSAFASNSTRNAFWDRIIINVWEHKDKTNSSLNCCCLLEDFNWHSTPVIEKLNYFVPASLNAKQFVCDGTNAALDNKIVQVSVVRNGTKCSESAEEYISVKYLYRPSKKTFGVSGKIVHGNKDPQELVEWFEFMKLFGVDTILMYPLNNLNEASIKVLRYYQQIGLVEVVPFHNVPLKDEYRREFTSQGNGMKYNDVQVMVFDSEERLKEYTYAVIMDTDECIVPIDRSIKTYTQLMETLLRSNLQYTGFYFLDQLYITTWGKMDDRHPLYIGQYLNRSEEVLDRRKIMFVPERIKQGSMTIHTMSGKTGFKSNKPVPKTVAVLKHYRSCRVQWTSEKCFQSFSRITDTSMNTLADVILPSVKRVRRKLGF